MPGFRNQVLILEDDATLGKALQQAFQKEGITVLATPRPEEAKDVLDKFPVGTLFVDCLLPAISGVEFAEQVRKQYPTSMLEIVLMSGIFTDPTFVKDSIRQTQAKAFLKKPFDLSEALKLVEKPMMDDDDNQVVHPRKVLYSLFSKGKVSAREKKKAIEALEEIHGFDLPYIYSMLVETKASGHLNIATQAGDVFGISFSDGAIVAVDIPDKETFLGKLLIEQGFVHPDDLTKAIKDQSQSGKKIGERLIQGHLLSPHALDIVMASQMNIRLSRAIIDEMVRVNFVEAEVEKTTPNIDTDSFPQFLHDWIASKITLDWLKSHFMQWSSCTINKSPTFTEDNQVLKMPLISSLDNILTALTDGRTLGQILDSQAFPEEPFLKAVHLMLTRGVITFTESTATKNSNDRLRFLKKVFAQFGDRARADMYHVMAKMTGGGDSDPDLVIREFKKLLGPEPTADEKDIEAVYKQLVTIAQQAYETIRANGNTKKDDPNRGEGVIKMKAATLYDEGKMLLQKAQYKLAHEKINAAMAIDAQLDKGRLYRAWAKIGSIDPSSVKEMKEKIIKEIQIDLVQVSPEDKMDALYQFVLGLLAKAKGDSAAAKKHLEKSIAMDNSLIYARRELTMLTNVSTQKKDVFQQDLRDLVGGFFKKR